MALQRRPEKKNKEIECGVSGAFETSKYLRTLFFGLCSMLKIAFEPFCYLLFISNFHNYVLTNALAVASREVTSSNPLTHQLKLGLRKAKIVLIDGT